MTHPSQLELSMHADNALPAVEASAVTQHIESCTECQASLAAMQGEMQ